MPCATIPKQGRNMLVTTFLICSTRLMCNLFQINFLRRIKAPDEHLSGGDVFRRICADSAIFLHFCFSTTKFDAAGRKRKALKDFAIFGVCMLGKWNFKRARVAGSLIWYFTFRGLAGSCGHWGAQPGHDHEAADQTDERAELRSTRAEPKTVTSVIIIVDKLTFRVSSTN